MWKLEPLGYDAAEVAPITAITSEPVVIGRKTGGIADVPQFVAVHKKHAELRDGGAPTVLGTAAHPGLLDDLAPRADTTVILRGFRSLHVESRERNITLLLCCYFAVNILTQTEHLEQFLRLFG
mgnify:CR=1 FL=1